MHDSSGWHTGWIWDRSGRPDCHAVGCSDLHVLLPFLCASATAGETQLSDVALAYLCPCLSWVRKVSWKSQKVQQFHDYYWKVPLPILNPQKSQPHYCSIMWNLKNETAILHASEIFLRKKKKKLIGPFSSADFGIGATPSKWMVLYPLTTPCSKTLQNLCSSPSPLTASINGWKPWRISWAAEQPARFGKYCYGWLDAYTQKIVTQKMEGAPCAYSVSGGSPSAIVSPGWPASDWDMLLIPFHLLRTESWSKPCPSWITSGGAYLEPRAQAQTCDRPQGTSL